MARPTVMTKETIAKLREAFLIGATDDEACGYANIGARTLYDYQEKHPEFTQKKRAWKEQPILKAKSTVVKSLENVPDAKWYLEHKASDEFSKRTEHDVTQKEIKLDEEEAKKAEKIMRQNDTSTEE